MKYAFVIVSPELLKDVLHWPDETKFVKANVQEDGQLAFLLEHPAFPEVPPTVPLLNPRYKQVDGQVEFDWNLENVGTYRG